VGKREEGRSGNSSASAAAWSGLWDGGAEAVWRIWEKLATAVRFAETVGRLKEEERVPRTSVRCIPEWEAMSCQSGVDDGTRLVVDEGKLGMGRFGGAAAGRMCAADERRRWAMADTEGAEGALVVGAGGVYDTGGWGWSIHSACA
jgi:hypothetical protein